MNLPPVGARVKTKEKLGATKGMLVSPRHILSRKTGAAGNYVGFVPGHGGDVWWVDHGGGDVAAYSYDELVLLEEQSHEST